jgi:hypothetical protein
MIHENLLDNFEKPFYNKRAFASFIVKWSVLPAFCLLLGRYFENILHNQSEFIPFLVIAAIFWNLANFFILNAAVRDLKYDFGKEPLLLLFLFFIICLVATFLVDIVSFSWCMYLLYNNPLIPNDFIAKNYDITLIVSFLIEMFTTLTTTMFELFFALPVFYLFYKKLKNQTDKAHK